MALSKLANWWDKQKLESEQILTDWVQENPQWWAIAIAATTQTAMDLGSGFVDVLRFGEGFAEGGWKGVGKDTLRLLMLLGPLGRAGGAVSRFLTPLIQSGNLRVAIQVTGVDGPCTFQAVNNAVSIMKGRNIFVTVKDMAGAVGKQLSQLSKDASGGYELAAWVDEVVPYIRQMGVRVREVPGLKNIEEVVALARAESRPVIFAIRTTVTTASGATEEILHSVIAMRTTTGIVKFADYGGKYVKSLTELVSKWGKPSSAIELLQSGSSATVIEPAILTGELAGKLAKGAILIMEGIAAIETNENGVELAVPATMVASSAPAISDSVDSDVIMGSFHAYKSRVSGKPLIHLGGVYVTAGSRKAPRPEWLTGVQYRLNALGFGAGKVDGVPGPRTRKAVAEFQRFYKLRMDSVPGPKTQEKLREVCGY